MKQRMNAAVVGVVAMNLAATIAVFVLAYDAGVNSGGKGLWQFREMHAETLYLLLCAAAALVGDTMFVFFRLSDAVCLPMKALARFSEAVSDGNFEARLDAVGGGTFGYINLHLNEAAARAAKLQKDKGEHLQRFQSVMEQVGNGDMTARGMVNGDALDSVINSVNSMLENLTAVLCRVRDAADGVSVNAKEIVSTSKTTVVEANQQHQEVVNTSVALQELLIANRQVSAYSETGAEAARRALEAAEVGTRSVRNTQEGIQRIRTNVQAAANKIEWLGGRSLEIAEMVQAIDEITEKANLLALNAAIEAARAGESGRGFAIVAEDVRKLAEHLRSAAKDIATMMTAVSGESTEAITAMQIGTREAEMGARVAEQAGRALEAMAALVRQSVEVVQQISMASKQQSSGMEGVANAIQTVSGLTRQNSLGARQNARSTEKLMKLSDELHETLSRFKLPVTVAQPRRDSPAGATQTASAEACLEDSPTSA